MCLVVDGGVCSGVTRSSGRGSGNGAYMILLVACCHREFADVRKVVLRCLGSRLSRSAFFSTALNLEKGEQTL